MTHPVEIRLSRRELDILRKLEKGPVSEYVACKHMDSDLFHEALTSLINRKYVVKDLYTRQISLTPRGSERLKLADEYNEKRRRTLAQRDKRRA